MTAFLSGDGSSNGFHTIGSASGFIDDGNSPVLPSNGRTTLSKVRDLYARSGTGTIAGFLCVCFEGNSILSKMIFFYFSLAQI